jgi:hypothetical protein
MKSLYKQITNAHGTVVGLFEFHSDDSTYWLMEGKKRTLEPYGQLDKQGIEDLFTKLKAWAGYTKDKPK